MMTFGQDRLPEKERACPAWPADPDTTRKAAYTRWIKGAASEVSYKPCSACGGPFGYGQDWAHGGEPGAGPRHEKYALCLAYLETHPIGPQYGPTLADLAPPVMAPAVVAEDGGAIGSCDRCGRSDFRTVKGREWHLINNPDCARWRKPDRHAYATL